MNLKDRVAIITGAAGGIGAAIAVGYAKEGAKVVIADILNGRKTVEALDKAAGEAIFVETDVTIQEKCDAMAKAAVDRFGRIDILVNNAAMYANIIKKAFHEITTEEWNQVMAVNTTGPFHCIKAVFPYMKEKGGKIVNVASSIIYEGAMGMPHYVASKGAVMAFTRSMARELGAFNINVNSLAPGYTQSEASKIIQKSRADGGIDPEQIMMQKRCLKRSEEPEDLVGTAIFLASDMSDFVTGQLILCDGGASFH
ncbi:MAG: SDR family oxidoreductase [Desulfobacteraceae bacterium]|jgi:NAD(P)-dependent dehydrogenase (short-subunit alcohol dehydrogenase family)